MNLRTGEYMHNKDMVWLPFCIYAIIVGYTGNILMVGINYDKDTKIHECKIEKHEKKW